MTPNPWRTTTDTDSMGRVRVRKPAIERFFTYATDVCRRGHPMADAYLFSGRRACRTCHLAAQHRYQSRRKAAA